MRSLIETTHPVFDNCDGVLTEYLRIETLEERSDEVHLLTHSLIRIRNDQRIDPHIDKEDQHFSDFMGKIQPISPDSIPWRSICSRWGASFVSE